MKTLILFITFSIIINLNNIYSAQFTNTQDLIPGIYNGGMAFGDIDNDNDLDMIINGIDISNLYYSKTYKNDGSGNFSFFEDINPGVLSGYIALGDIDNDGDLDLVMIGYTGSPIFKSYKNNGNGSFTFFEDIGTGSTSGPIKINDIDNDGDLDLVISDLSFNGPEIYKNNGNGSFAFYEKIVPGASAYKGLSVGDIDNDGDYDLVMTGWDGTNYRFESYKNNGTGNFTFFETIGSLSDQITLADFDADGDLDLVVLTGGPLQFKVYKNNGSGTFAFFNNICLGQNGNVSSIILGDIDNDGDSDSIVITGVYNIATNFKIHKNDGTGNFTFFEYITPGFWGTISGMALGDIDNDGDLDLAIAGLTNTNVACFKIYKNQESTINNPPQIPTGMTSTNVGGFWGFKWNGMSDDHTSDNMVQYKIAIGTNDSGIFNYSSACIDYPRGQANIGNVCVATAKYYQSKIPIAKVVNWKICAIDTAFKNSVYCAEQFTLPPYSPTILKCNAIPDGKIEIAWNNVKNETSYTLFRNIINSNTSAIKIINTGANITNYMDTGLNVGTTYYYWVKAYNPLGSLGYSDVAMDTALPQLPTAPNILLKSDDASITVEGLSVNGADKYIIYWRKEISMNEDIILADGNSGEILGPTYTIKDIEYGAIYYIIAVSKNAGGISTLSDEISIQLTAISKKNKFKVKKSAMNLSKGDKMEFEYNAEFGAEVYFEIYTMTGDLVKKIRAQDYRGLWNGKNNKEKDVATGFYFLMMRVNGKIVNKKPVKIGVIK